MIVADLFPGDRVPMFPLGDQPATFVASTVHPLWPQLRLVIWRLPDGSWSHDALDARQDVGDPLPADFPARQAALRAALIGGQQQEARRG